MPAEKDISPEEELGRVLSNPDHIRALRRGRIPSNAFYHGGRTEVSVQRLCCCPVPESIRQAKLAIGTRPFLGWAVVSARAALREGCSVRATPTDVNPCHADIVFPPGAADNKTILWHAQRLARRAYWREPPTTQGSDLLPGD